MSREVIKVGVELDRETELVFRKWAPEEGRSKRRHASILMRRVGQLRSMGREALLKMPAAEILRHLELM